MTSPRPVALALAAALGLAAGAHAQVALTSAPPRLTLDACLLVALKHNRTLLTSRTRVDAANARERQVGRSQLPTLSAVLTEVKNEQGMPPYVGARQNSQKLVLSQTFQPFGRHDALHRAAGATRDAAAADAERTAQDVCLAVVRAFYDLLLAQELIAVAQASVDSLSTHREHTRDLLAHGAAARFDLLRAEVQLAGAQPALIQARYGRESALADLLHLLGVDPGATPAVEGVFPAELPAGLPDDEDAAVAVALERRPDLDQARSAHEAARQALRAARQALQPSVTLSGNEDHARGARPPADEYQSNYSLQAALNFPFFDSGLSRAQAREAAANLEAARLALENTVSSVRVELRKALALVRQTDEVVRSQQLSVAQAEEALAIARKAYGTGTVTTLDVLDAEVSLTRTRTTWNQALRDRAVAIAALQRAVGLFPGAPMNDRAKEAKAP